MTSLTLATPCCKARGFDERRLRAAGCFRCGRFFRQILLRFVRCRGDVRASRTSFRQAAKRNATATMRRVSLRHGFLLARATGSLHRVEGLICVLSIDVSADCNMGATIQPPPGGELAAKEFFDPGCVLTLC